VIQKTLSYVAQIGVNPEDPDDIRLQKTLLVVIALMVIPAAVLWGIIYLIFGEGLAASIPLSYAVISSLSIFVFSRTKRYQFYRFSQLFLIVLLPFLLMMALGGFVNSSAVIIW
jgi:guanylate cyclase